MSIPVLITLIGMLIALTNVVVEVVKKATWDKIPTNALAVIIAQILTISAGFAYIQINSIAFIWYYLVAMIIGGFMVSFGAMFGFDKLKEIMNWSQENK